MNSKMNYYRRPSVVPARTMVLNLLPWSATTTCAVVFFALKLNISGLISHNVLDAHALRTTGFAENNKTGTNGECPCCAGGAQGRGVLEGGEDAATTAPTPATCSRPRGAFSRFERNTKLFMKRTKENEEEKIDPACRRPTAEFLPGSCFNTQRDDKQTASGAPAPAQETRGSMVQQEQQQQQQPQQQQIHLEQHLPVSPPQPGQVVHPGSSSPGLCPGERTEKGAVLPGGEVVWYSPGHYAVLGPDGKLHLQKSDGVTPPNDVACQELGWAVVMCDLDTKTGQLCRIAENCPHNDEMKRRAHSMLLEQQKQKKQLLLQEQQRLHEQQRLLEQQGSARVVDAAGVGLLKRGSCPSSSPGVPAPPAGHQNTAAQQTPKSPAAVAAPSSTTTKDGYSDESISRSTHDHSAHREPRSSADVTMSSCGATSTTVSGGDCPGSSAANVQFYSPPWPQAGGMWQVMPHHNPAMALHCSPGQAQPSPLVVSPCPFVWAAPAAPYNDPGKNDGSNSMPNNYTWAWCSPCATYTSVPAPPPGQLHGPADTTGTSGATPTTPQAGGGPAVFPDCNTASTASGAVNTVAAKEIVSAPEAEHETNNIFGDQELCSRAETTTTTHAQSSQDLFRSALRRASGEPRFSQAAHEKMLAAREQHTTSQRPREKSTSRAAHRHDQQPARRTTSVVPPPAKRADGGPLRPGKVEGQAGAGSVKNAPAEETSPGGRAATGTKQPPLYVPPQKRAGAEAGSLLHPGEEFYSGEFSYDFANIAGPSTHHPDAGSFNVARPPRGPSPPGSRPDSPQHAQPPSFDGGMVQAAAAPGKDSAIVLEQGQKNPTKQLLRGKRNRSQPSRGTSKPPGVWLRRDKNRDEMTQQPRGHSMYDGDQRKGSYPEQSARSPSRGRSKPPGVWQRGAARDKMTQQPRGQSMYDGGQRKDLYDEQSATDSLGQQDDLYSEESASRYVTDSPGSSLLTDHLVALGHYHGESGPYGDFGYYSFQPDETGEQ
ncbi:unnamed protein product [Amoebophrya sp. A120]|nr:unnamed protein product [Amoebophrya sp. A120]|eukprot:GSA120T00025096001.1